MKAAVDKPVVLLTNDDGFDSPLMLAWAEELRDMYTPVIVAPVHEMSWASARHVVTRPVRVRRQDRRDLTVYRVTGSPVDCVHLAIQHLGIKPALVFSGPNFGLNAGAIRIVFSGTVQAALAATRLGVPSVALSIYYPRTVRQQHSRVKDLKPALYRNELAACMELVRMFHRQRILHTGCLNINLPYPSSDPSKARMVRVHQDSNIDLFDRVGPMRFRAKPAYPDFDGVPADTDMGAVSRGLIAVSSLAVQFDDMRCNSERKPQGVRRRRAASRV